MLQRSYECLLIMCELVLWSLNVDQLRPFVKQQLTFIIETLAEVKKLFQFRTDRIDIPY